MLTTKPYDICIVGAGVAGALVASVAARKGLNVLIIEAGSRFDFDNRPSQLERSEILREPLWPWEREGRDHYVDSSFDMLGFSYNLNTARVKAVGGTTLHWGGMALRLRESDFRTATLYGLGVDWPVQYAELEPYYTRAEWELGVAGTPNRTDPPRSKAYPMPGFPPKYGEKSIWWPAAEKLDISLEVPAHARNSQPYGGRSACIAYSACNICPSGARYSADFHIKEAERTGRCTVLEQTVARRIDLDGSGRVKGIHVSGVDGREHLIRARSYVVAAHAVETARLLLLSNVGNHSGQVGKNLMEHWYVGASGYHPIQSFPDRIGFTTLRCGSFYDGAERAGRGAIELEFATARDPLLGMRHTKQWGRAFRAYECQEFGHRIIVYAETEQQSNPNSVVELDAYETDQYGDPVPHIRFGLTAIDHATHRQAKKYCATLLDAAGAREIKYVHRMDGARHHMGTCRMSDDPDSGVVDRNCRVHGIENLYLAGSSVFPTSGARQPTLTIAALALRLAERIT